MDGMSFFGKGFQEVRRKRCVSPIDLIVRVACLLTDFPEIRELDMNPVRILEEGSGVRVLDAWARITDNSLSGCNIL